MGIYPSSLTITNNRRGIPSLKHQKNSLLLHRLRPTEESKRIKERIRRIVVVTENPWFVTRLFWTILRCITRDERWHGITFNQQKKSIGDDGCRRRRRRHAIDPGSHSRLCSWRRKSPVRDPWERSRRSPGRLRLRKKSKATNERANNRIHQAAKKEIRNESSPPSSVPPQHHQPTAPCRQLQSPIWPHQSSSIVYRGRFVWQERSVIIFRSIVFWLSFFSREFRDCSSVSTTVRLFFGRTNHKVCNFLALFFLQVRVLSTRDLEREI